MSSQYPVLDNRRIDQWKVTELKEELRRRKLTTKGLKEDLIKRLDEAIRNESEVAESKVDNGLDCDPQSQFQSEDAGKTPVIAEAAKDIMEDADKTDEDARKTPVVAEAAMDIMDDGDKRDEKVDGDYVLVDIDDSAGSLGKEKIVEGEIFDGTDSTGLEREQVVEATTVETSALVSESVVSEIAFSGKEPQDYETPGNSGVSKSQLELEDAKPLHEDAKIYSSESNQVSEVSPVLGIQVKSDSISTDSVSINEKNELKDNIIADDVKLELDVKPEMVQPPSSNIVPDGGNSQPVDVEEPRESKVSVEETDVYSIENADTGKKNDSGDVGSSEKLNLDRSSGDDSMEEDALESKQIDSKFHSDEVGDGVEKIEVPMVVEGGPVYSVGDDLPAENLPAEKKNVNDENKNGLAVSSVKRKLHDQEAVGNSELTKRQRRWNSEGLKIPEPQSISNAPSTTPKDSFQSSVKRNFSRSDSTLSDEVPKERVVPPSPKPPTSSLRIDRFLRPFTLKAVQELLGKTGTVTSFWMDHIKTHCYVTYSSVEEAIETRNAVYNLQWPPNGGRLLAAEFVDPLEVTMRAEAPPQSPVTPASAGPSFPPAPPAPALQPQPSPHQQVQRQQLPPPPPLPPPPQLSNPPPARERVPLPPPPPLPLPLPEKVDPPIVTLDDLFRKTKATPRIYYLPLSEEQVAAKLKAQGKTAKQ